MNDKEAAMGKEDQMRFFFLFAPNFLELALGIIRAIAGCNLDAKFMGLVTGPSSLYDRVTSHQDPNIEPLFRLDDLEREWLETPYDPQRLKWYEEELGSWGINLIIIGDRQIGNGFISGGRFPRTQLVERAEKHDGIRRYLTGLLEFTFNMLEEHRPDVVFCFAVAGAPAIALSLACKHLGIAFRSLTPTRLGNGHIIDDSPQGLLVPVRRKFTAACRDSSLVQGHLEAARDVLTSFRSNPERYLRQSSVESRLAGSPSAVKRQLVADLKSLAYWLVKRPPLLLRKAHPFTNLWFHLRTHQQGRRVLRSNTFHSLSHLSANDYVYYTLHVDPEASTMVLSPLYTDQAAIVEVIAKSIPTHMDLYVKEHLPMLGLRPEGFYERLARIPKVKLISPFEDTFRLIQEAKLTITITGTVAWEALLLQKPALVIGNSPYLAIGEGVMQCSDPSSLPHVIKDALSMPPANDERLTLYIATLLSLSFECPRQLRWGNPTREQVDNHRSTVEIMADQIVSSLSGQQWYSTLQSRIV